MDEEQIRPGDLAVVYRPTECCGNVTHIGRIFTVKAIVLASGDCHFCKKHKPMVSIACNNSLGGFELQTVKKIKPLGELDDATSSACKHIPETVGKK